MSVVVYFWHNLWPKYSLKIGPLFSCASLKYKEKMKLSLWMQSLYSI